MEWTANAAADHDLSRGRNLAGATTRRDAATWREAAGCRDLARGGGMSRHLADPWRATTGFVPLRAGACFARDGTEVTQ